MPAKGVSRVGGLGTATVLSGAVATAAVLTSCGTSNSAAPEQPSRAARPQSPSRVEPPGSAAPSKSPAPPAYSNSGLRKARSGFAGKPVIVRRDVDVSAPGSADHVRTVR
ncbi:hypothetical protein [Streptomyces sp. NPDC096013]|uniref:hypothetical protein n=1 Tax=Streptomyces sp. NPDC096013 TaxID=3366069 RepID=UPI003825594C